MDPTVAKAKLIKAMEILQPASDQLKAEGYHWDCSAHDAQGKIILTVVIYVRP